MKTRTALVIGMLIASGAARIEAVNGFSVTIFYRGGEDCWNRGNLVRNDIVNNAVAAHDTLFKGKAQWPAINFTGTKVAFFRWGSTSTTNCVSVIDKTGGAVTDLVTGLAAPLVFPAPVADVRDPMLDWPAGDWVYYEKPTKSHEIWRVNVNNPARNEKVVTYVKSPKGEDSRPIYFYRWSMSVDAKWALIWSAGYTWNSNIMHCFPPTGGDPLACAPCGGAGWAQIYACNGAISPSGTFACHYTGGAHEQIEVLGWDHVTTGTTWPYGGGGSITLSIAGAEQLRFSANSDRWIQEQVGWEGHAMALCAGSNQWLINWKDKTTIVASDNPRGTGKCSDAGDFWIDGGAQNAGKYEDANGSWVAVAPIDPITSSAAAPPPAGRTIGRTAPHLLCGDRGLVVQWKSGPAKHAVDARGRKIAGDHFGREREGDGL
jgi:hypothetical protein